MKHAQTLNEAQFRKVLHYCRTRRHANRDMTIFMVSFFAGLRAKEIAALKLGDVFDADGGVREQFTLETDQTKGALKEKRPDKIQVNFERTTIAQKSYHLNTSRFSEILRHTISPIFVDFYENAKHSVERQYGNSYEHWPPIWNFARVVRNACAHGGHLHMAGQNPRPVLWHHLNYNQALNGRQIVGYDLSVGDMLVLLFELGDELDRTVRLG